MNSSHVPLAIFAFPLSRMLVPSSHTTYTRYSNLMIGMRGTELTHTHAPCMAVVGNYRSIRKQSNRTLVQQAQRQRYQRYLHLSVVTILIAPTVRVGVRVTID